jgi:hypothetical protein
MRMAAQKKKRESKFEFHVIYSLGFEIPTTDFLLIREDKTEVEHTK